MLAGETQQDLTRTPVEGEEVNGLQDPCVNEPNPAMIHPLDLLHQYQEVFSSQNPECFSNTARLLPRGFET